MTKAEFKAILARSGGPWSVEIEKRETYYAILCFCGTKTPLTAQIAGHWQSIADFKYKNKAFVCQVMPMTDNIDKIMQNFYWFQAVLGEFLTKNGKKTTRKG